MKLVLRFDLGKQYFRNGEYRNAGKQLQAYLVEKPTDSEARILLGKCYEGLHAFPNAQIEYERVLQDDPQNLKAMIALSEFLQSHGNILRAINMADKMITLQSERATKDDLQALAKSLELLWKRQQQNLYPKNPAFQIFYVWQLVPKNEAKQEKIQDTDIFQFDDKREARGDLNLPFNDLIELSDEGIIKDKPIDEHGYRILSMLIRHLIFKKKPKPLMMRHFLVAMLLLPSVNQGFPESFPANTA